MYRVRLCSRDLFCFTVFSSSSSCTQKNLLLSKALQFLNSLRHNFVYWLIDTYRFLRDEFVKRLLNVGSHSGGVTHLDTKY